MFPTLQPMPLGRRDLPFDHPDWIFGRFFDVSVRNLEELVGSLESAEATEHETQIRSHNPDNCMHGLFRRTVWRTERKDRVATRGRTNRICDCDSPLPQPSLKPIRPVDSMLQFIV